MMKILLMLFVLISCLPKEKQENSIVLREYFTQGDLKEYFHHTTLRPDLPKAEVFAKDFKNFFNYGKSRITNVEASKDYDAIVEDETPHEHTDIKISYPYELIKVSNSEYHYVPIEENIDQVKFVFSVNEDQSLKLDKFYFHVNNQKVVKFLHYSQNIDRSAMSFLIYTESGNQDYLYSFYFGNKKEEETKDPTSTPQTKVSEDKEHYEYLFPGYPSRWEGQNVHLNVCGSDQFYNHIEHAVALWNEALNKKFTIELKQLKEYPPFTDLNHQCIYQIENFKMTDPNQTAIKPAVTYASSNLSKLTLMDADIFIYTDELEKLYNKNKTDQSTQDRDLRIDSVNPIVRYITHEIGHFLGLGHQFDKTIQSIMSYEEIFKITEHDKKAIQSLYK